MQSRRMLEGNGVNMTKLDVLSFCTGILVLCILVLVIYFVGGLVYELVSRFFQLLSEPRTAFETCKVLLLGVIAFQLGKISRRVK